MVDMSEKTCKDCGFTGDQSLFRPKTRQCWDCRKKYLREYEEKNRAKRTAQKLAWAAANPEKAKIISKQTKHRNRERVCAENNRRRIKKAQAKGSHTLQEWIAICILARWRCLCCKEEKPLTRDHIIPISKGGSDYIFNIQPLCRSCNSKKGVKTTDFRLALGSKP